MSVRKFITYAKLSGITLMFVGVLIFMVSNLDTVSIEFLWWQTPEVPKFAFMLSAAAIGVLVFRVAGGIRRVVTDLRQIRREEKARLEIAAEVRKEVTEKESSQKGVV